jgi:hypothetical protein
MSEQDVDRRRFLQQLGLAAAFGLGATALAGCGGKTQEPCSDLSGLSAQDRQTRVTYGYRAESLIEAKHCENCNFWKPPVGGPCGSCSLVKGPISPQGYCNSWAQPVPAGQTAPPATG